MPLPPVLEPSHWGALLALAFSLSSVLASTPALEHDTTRKQVILADAERNLVLRLNPFAVDPGQMHVEYTLSSLDYDQAYDRGRFPGLRGDSIREVLNPIARVGVVDRKFHGSNNWRLGYAVLHEPWIAQLGLAIADPYYFEGCAETIDYQRDHAIDEQGRVKSRWCYDAGDALPGTFDTLGFYETQWGYLMDSQPSFVMNVCDQFDFTGNLEWVHWQEAACERVLQYMLRRDSDSDGLLECLTDSIAEKKSSDWIDVVWAGQSGAGNDILSNNANPVVGLYRNIYGIQPRHNRLLLNPRLVPELNGTQLSYWLRGQTYRIDLKTNENCVSTGRFTVVARGPFGVNSAGDTLEYFSGQVKSPALSIVRSSGVPLEIQIDAWASGPEGLRKWTEKGPSGEARALHTVWGLKPDSDYRLSPSNGERQTLRSDANGRVMFEQAIRGAQPVTLEIAL